ncbi:hypothetical protein OL548_23980 [Lysinibacillus sp. MHQ-1]|nr:hypothetical protein OL548_23980 [Lysinibacillus sp. MHQ-1]
MFLSEISRTLIYEASYPYLTNVAILPTSYFFVNRMSLVVKKEARAEIPMARFAIKG